MSEKELQARIDALQAALETKDPEGHFKQLLDANTESRSQIAALQAELSQHEKCVYDPDDHGTMTTGCNHISGIPNNSQRFCTFCGSPIRFSWEKTPMGTKPRPAPEKIDIEMTDEEHDKFWEASAKKCKCPSCSEMRTETEANDGECGHCNYHLVPDPEGGE